MSLTLTQALVPLAVVVAVARSPVPRKLSVVRTFGATRGVD